MCGTLMPAAGCMCAGGAGGDAPWAASGSIFSLLTSEKAAAAGAGKGGGGAGLEAAGPFKEKGRHKEKQKEHKKKKDKKDKKDKRHREHREHSDGDEVCVCESSNGVTATCLSRGAALVSSRLLHELQLAWFAYRCAHT